MDKTFKSNNPYDILGVLPGSQKQEIAKAFALAMKKKQYPVKIITQAQKELLDPQKRLLADYMRPILSKIKPFKKHKIEQSEFQSYQDELEILPEFSSSEISESDILLKFDRSFGQILFD
jgi:DnaJ-class molecular chaperone